MALFKDNRELDSSIVAWIILGIVIMILVGLFVLELRATGDKRYLTPELIHFILGTVFGWVGSIVTSHWMKRNGHDADMNKDNKRIDV